MCGLMARVCKRVCVWPRWQECVCGLDGKSLWLRWQECVWPKWQESVCGLDGKSMCVAKMARESVCVCMCVA